VGIEHTTENGLGLPRSGQERVLARQVDGPDAATEGAPLAPLRYIIQTDVPRTGSLCRFLIDQQQEQIACGARITGVGGGSQGIRWAVSSSPAGWMPIVIWCEEECRARACVCRMVQRSRWINGSTHLWISKRRVQEKRAAGCASIRPFQNKITGEFII
jgi:hypothetical protein